MASFELKLIIIWRNTITIKTPSIPETKVVIGSDMMLPPFLYTAVQSQFVKRQNLPSQIQTISIYLTVSKILVLVNIAINNPQHFSYPSGNRLFVERGDSILTGCPLLGKDAIGEDDIELETRIKI